MDKITDDILKLDEERGKNKLLELGFKDGKTVYNDLLSLRNNGIETVSEILSAALCSGSPDEAVINLERIASACGMETIKAVLNKKNSLGLLLTLTSSSPFLSNVVTRNPAYLEKLLIEDGIFTEKNADIFLEEITRWGVIADSSEEFSSVLRKYRNNELLRIGWRDLAGISSMEQTGKEVADLASASLDAAVTFVSEKLKEQYGKPIYEENGGKKEAEFAVLGLGKLGGRELNYSSDIDIIYVYSSDEGETEGTGKNPSSAISLHAYFVKFAEKVSKLLNEVTEDGFVFRVDLDLRPEGKSGAIANSLRSMEIYYESWGRTWERSAMIKARTVAGSRKLGERFVKMIRPFVYRKYLDFTAIEEIKSMKEKIDINLLIRRPDAVDVKLGAGGIREIEFFTQALQLIYGGKDTDIREENTLKALKKLAVKKLITPEEEKILSENYVFLRNLEHRIQMVELRQTQAIPAGDEELLRLAAGMGLKTKEGLWAEYKKRTAAVHSTYKTLFYGSEDELKKSAPEDALIALSPDTPEERVNEILKKMGFAQITSTSACVKALRNGAPHVNMPARAGEILKKIAPVILMKASESVDPDVSLANMERFISCIGGRTAVYAMLGENPKLIEVLIKIFSASAFLSNALTEHAENLELLLSREMSKPRKLGVEMEKEISGAITGTVDFEERLYALRRLKNQEVFRIGVNDILGELETEEVSSQISDFAEAALNAAIKVAKDELSVKYGSVEGEMFFILGMGKLAGRELIYGSDLDIVFVYENNGEEGKTSGPKIISDHEYYTRLAQKIISVLSVRTSAGIVFAMDARLRPTGSSGPLVVTREALLKYQEENASAWERQAAIKSRPVAGNIEFGEKTARELAELIYSKGISALDASEMIRIRKRMEDEIAKEDSSTVDIKNGKGGLVDIEFLSQALILKHGSIHPKIRTPHTITALTRLAENKLMDENDALFLKDAYCFIRRIETRLRITHDSSSSIIKKNTVELKTLAKKLDFRDEESLWSEYAKKSERVRSIYLKTLNAIAENQNP